MSGFLPLPRFLPCLECGEAVAFEELEEHECDEEFRLDHQMSRLGELINQFEWELLAWLATPQGRFAVYLAARDRSRAAAAA